MTIRALQPSDADALPAFFERIPAAERTFFREEPLDRALVERWLTDERGRRAVDARGEQIVGYVGVVALPGWSDHVGEVRLVVDPAARRHGVGRALARHALQDAVACGLRKLVVEVVAEQEGAIAMFEALGFRAEGLLRDHVRAHDGTLRDLVLLAHPVEDQWAGMAAAGLEDALG